MKCTKSMTLSFVLIGLCLILSTSVSARFISIDPAASKYPDWSPYAYALDNPIKYIDPDGRDVAFNVYQTPKTKQYGHMDVHFQDSKGGWFKYDQGNYGVNIGPSEGPPSGSLLLRTTSDQDALIAQSALQSKADHDSGKLKYSEYSNNCKDAAVAVVNNSGAGITLDNPTFTITPSGWFDEQKKATVQVVVQPEAGQSSDATKVVTVTVLPKYELVPPPDKQN